MRKLVYRVQPLPEGLLPLVMDFGAVTSEINQDGVLSGSEQEYIAKMISNHVRSYNFILNISAMQLLKIFFQWLEATSNITLCMSLFCDFLQLNYEQMSLRL